MVKGVISDHVTLVHDTLHRPRIPFGVLSNEEEGRADAVLLQKVQNLRGVGIVRPVIKGKRDPLLVRGATAVRAAEQVEARQKGGAQDSGEEKEDKEEEGLPPHCEEPPLAEETRQPPEKEYEDGQAGQDDQDDVEVDPN